MGNSHFQFKQFSIEQNDAAMKLGIDSVTLGALATHESISTILDIGTGTGILALMMAQRFPEAAIDAIEVDENAFLNAHRNVDQSPFSKQIQLYHCALQNFETTQAYDLIICNPPYFDEDIKPDDLSRKTARHTDSLPLNTLFLHVSKWMEQNACFWCVYPTKNYERLKSEAETAGLHIQTLVNIKHHSGKPPKRFVAKFGFNKQPIIEKELILKDGTDYSEPFKKLTKDFYLAF